MSRGQQGIGISAAGMYGVLTTGKPVKIISQDRRRRSRPTTTRSRSTPRRTSPRSSTARAKASTFRRATRARRCIDKHGIEWVEQPHGTRVTIELEAKYQRGRGSVDEYLEQTAIANPHVHAALHRSRRQRARLFERSTDRLPPEPKEIKPHPYGVELGRLVTMLKDTKAATISQFLTRVVLARQLRRGPQDLRDGQDSARGRARTRSAGTRPTRCTRRFRRRKIAPPATDCISPIGEELMLKGLHQVVPGEFYCGGHAAAGRVSRQSVSDRSRPGLRRRSRRRRTSRSKLLPRAARRERRPHAAAVPDEHVQRPRRRCGRQDPQGSRAGHAAVARQAQAEGDRSSCTRRCRT